MLLINKDLWESDRIVKISSSGDWNSADAMLMVNGFEFEITLVFITRIVANPIFTTYNYKVSLFALLRPLHM